MPIVDATTSTDGQRGTLSIVCNALEQRGHEVGYSRGVNDVLATLLEAAHDFSRIHPVANSSTLKMLLAFSVFLEDKMERRPQATDYTFVDGSGI